MVPIAEAAVAVQRELREGKAEQVEKTVKQAEYRGIDLDFKHPDSSKVPDLKTLFAEPAFEQLPSPDKIKVMETYYLDFTVLIRRWDGTKAIANSAGKIFSITLPTGEVIPETPAPGWSKYAGALAFAPLGFLIPWGLVRLLAWTVAGFLPPIRFAGFP